MAVFLQNDAYTTIRSSMSLGKNSKWATAIHLVAPNPAPHWCLLSWSPTWSWWIIESS